MSLGISLEGDRPDMVDLHRVEVEKLDDGRKVVHASGLGGRGYETNWGVAKDVLKLLNEEVI